MSRNSPSPIKSIKSLQKRSMDKEASSEELIVLADGRKLAAKVWGCSIGASVTVPPASRWLMIHGYLDNAATFDLLAPLMLQKGIAMCLVALDMAGHGKSQWREIYHALDNVPDLFFAADAIKWDAFSVLGHSLGGGVAQCAASAFPERIPRLVVIEALGWWSQLSQDLSKNLRTAIKVAQSRNDPDRQRADPYSSLEDCAERRSKMNLVGSLPLDAARILVSRVVKKDPRGGLTWSSDPALLLPSRFRLDEGAVQAFLRRIDSPMLLVFARDGLFERFTIPPVPLFSVAWCTVTCCAYIGSGVLDKVAGLLGVRVLAKLHDNCRIAFNFCIRWLKLRSATTVLLAAGGHHPHLTAPTDVVGVIQSWAVSNGSRQLQEADKGN